MGTYPYRSVSGRPRIVVSGPNRGGLFAWLFTQYAIRRAGGRPIRMTPEHTGKSIAFDGLVIGGGADIDPDLYGQIPGFPKPERQRSLLQWLLAIVFYPLLYSIRLLFSTKQYKRLDKARDELEYQLLRQALEHDKPVLGICRGAQLINVYLGGDLNQDISGFYTETPYTWSLLPRKTIFIETNTLLRRILQTDYCQVNALHNQSIHRLGEQIAVSAYEHIGVVQAIESTAHSYLLGVQWHPEYLPHHIRQRRLFDSLVNHAARQTD